MQSAKYQEPDFPPYPLTERISDMSFLATGDGARKDLAVGIKTVTHNQWGIKGVPYKTVSVEIKEGDEVANFDLPASSARAIGQRLLEYAAMLEGWH